MNNELILTNTQYNIFKKDFEELDNYDKIQFYKNPFFLELNKIPTIKKSDEIVRWRYNISRNRYYKHRINIIRMNCNKKKEQLFEFINKNNLLESIKVIEEEKGLKRKEKSKKEEK